jgi:hippurate hydrolase
MIDDGMLEKFPVKGAYGLHNWPGTPVGSFAVVRGPAMASADALDIIVDGIGGHAAQPHTTRDPIVAAAHIITSAQSIVSRVIDPLDQAVLSITAISGGEAYNVIPDRVALKCGFRAFSPKVAETIESELRRICASTAEAFKCRVTVSRPDITPYPPTVNHPQETDIALKAMRAVAGEANVRDDARPVMGSEDFSFVLQKVPGAYIFLGNGDSAGLHNPAYDFNDGAIQYGVAYWVALAGETLPV